METLIETFRIYVEFLETGLMNQCHSMDPSSNEKVNRTLGAFASLPLSFSMSDRVAESQLRLNEFSTLLRLLSSLHKHTCSSHSLQQNNCLIVDSLFKEFENPTGDTSSLFWKRFEVLKEREKDLPEVYASIFFLAHHRYYSRAFFKSITDFCVNSTREKWDNRFHLMAIFDKLCLKNLGVENKRKSIDGVIAAFMTNDLASFMQVYGKMSEQIASERASLKASALAYSGVQDRLVRMNTCISYIQGAGAFNQPQFTAKQKTILLDYLSQMLPAVAANRVQLYTQYHAMNPDMRFEHVLAFLDTRYDVGPDFDPMVPAVAPAVLTHAGQQFVGVHMGDRDALTRKAFELFIEETRGISQLTQPQKEELFHEFGQFLITFPTEAVKRDALHTLGFDFDKINQEVQGNWQPDVWRKISSNLPHYKILTDAGSGTTATFLGFQPLRGRVTNFEGINMRVEELLARCFFFARHYVDPLTGTDEHDNIMYALIVALAESMEEGAQGHKTYRVCDAGKIQRIAIRVWQGRIKGVDVDNVASLRPVQGAERKQRLEEREKAIAGGAAAAAAVPMDDDGEAYPENEQDMDRIVFQMLPRFLMQCRIEKGNEDDVEDYNELLQLIKTFAELQGSSISFQERFMHHLLEYAKTQRMANIPQETQEEEGNARKRSRKQHAG